LAVPAAERIHVSVINAAGDHTLPTADLEKAFARLDSLESRRATEIQNLEARRADVEKKLPPSLVAVSKTLAAVKQFCDAISSHAKATDAFGKIDQELAVRQRWQRFIVQARDTFSAAEAKLAAERSALPEAKISI
jgi:predicted  nucleic acid-binding Zn-ribbon protein